jgi:hypothetical protein
VPMMPPYTACACAGCGVNVVRRRHKTTIAAMEICFAISLCLRMCSLVKMCRTICVRSSSRVFAQRFREREMECGPSPETGAEPTRHLVRMNYCLRSQKYSRATWVSRRKCSRINNMKAGRILTAESMVFRRVLVAEDGSFVRPNDVQIRFSTLMRT